MGYTFNENGRVGITERGNRMIRVAKNEDMQRILEIYEIARNNMRKSGNPNQWGDNYPTVEILEEHVKARRLFVDEIEGKVCGVFALVFGIDEYYQYIEDGNWLNEDDYATLHVVASSGEVKGAFERFFNFAKSKSNNIRIDTHMDNLIMQGCIKKQGFEYCGRIFVRNHSPRLAYQWVKNRNQTDINCDK